MSRTREYQALPVGSWMLYPSLFVGGVYDTNPSQAAGTRTPSFGGRVVPSLLAESNDGISKSTFYGTMDGRAYSADTASASDTISARTGFIQRYQPTVDWVVNAQADYTRQRDIFTTFGVDNSVNTLNTTSVGLAPTANPIAYNQYAAVATVQKTFGQAFLSATGSVVDLAYDSNAPGMPSASGTTYTGVGRGGFWLTPALYAVCRGQPRPAALRHQRHSTRRDTAPSAVLGSDQIGLFKGELYGGYQSEQFDFRRSAASRARCSVAASTTIPCPS